MSTRRVGTESSLRVKPPPIGLLSILNKEEEETSKSEIDQDAKHESIIENSNGETANKTVAPAQVQHEDNTRTQGEKGIAATAATTGVDPNHERKKLLNENEKRNEQGKLQKAWLNVKTRWQRRFSRIMVNPFKAAKRRKEAKIAELREKCILELGLNKALDQHWKDCDTLMRQVEAKDSIFELERIRKLVLARLLDGKVAEIEGHYPGKRSRHDRKLYHADIASLIEPVKEFDNFENLKRLYYATAAMDMYQRHNHDLRKKLVRHHRDSFFVKQKLRHDIADLEEKIDRARREKWCSENVNLWEPHRLPNTERKILAINGGPQSIDIDEDERCEESSGMARLVRKLQLTPLAYEVAALGKAHSDAISESF